jgi:FkbM family methyltransferase
MLDFALTRISRLIGKPPGWERVVRALAPPQRFAAAPLGIAMQPEGLVFPVDRGTLIGWSVHFFGTYEPEVRAALSRLQPGEVAVDIGANVGWHTLLMAARVGPRGHVYAFEPNPSTRGRLRAAVEANALAQVSVDPRAVADSPQPRAFEAPDAGHVWDGTGRLTGDAGPAGVEVPCTTLDEFTAERRLATLTLVKIDVEGWELAVLRGARRVLTTLRPRIIFEFDPAYVSRCGGSAAELMRLWQAASYAVYALTPGQRPVAAPSLGERCGNFLAMPREQGDPR